MTTLTITDGTTTVDINSTAIRTLDGWVPSTPQLNENAIANLGDGDTLGVPTWRNVTETIPLLLIGNAATIAAAQQSLEKLVDQARQNRLTWGNTRVYLQVQFSHDAAVWRSEVLAGRVVPVDPAGRLAMGSMEVSLILTRRYYWEGPATALELTSQTTTVATTGYVTVYNDDDASTTTNWFQVASAQVTGDLPSPLKIELKNNSGGTRYARGIFFGNYVWMDPTTIDPILRGSEASGGATGTLASTTEAITHLWALSTAQLADMNGQYARILVAFSTEPKADTLMRAALQYNDGGTYIDLVIGEQIRAGGEVVLDLGAMPVPPGGAATASDDIYLALRGQAMSGSDSIVVDWAQFMPAGHGLFRHLRGVTLAVSAPNGASVFDDGIDRIIYTLESGVNVPKHRGFHAPLHVWPGRTQRMRVMVQGHTALEAGQVYQVKASYRPRRLTV
jgi:hypothetical protein